MSVAISDVATVPVGADLTAPDNSLRVLRGLEKAPRVDYKIATGLSKTQGDWAVLGDDGLLHEAGSTGKAATYLVFSGTDRFDVKATGAITVFGRYPGLLCQTSKFDAAPTYHAGSPLTYKLVSSVPKLTLATSGDAVLANVVNVSNGLMIFEMADGSAVVA